MDMQREKNHTLADGIRITLSNRGNISIALQVPVTDTNVIHELEKRTAWFVDKNSQYIDFAEDSRNFHITVQLFYCKKDQFAVLNRIINSMNLPLLVNIKITGNAIFGFHEKSKYPVALIDSPELMKIQAEFLSQLKKNGIECTSYDTGFKPHVSLFITGAPISEDSLEDCPKAVLDCKEPLNFSHKNNINQYHTLTKAHLTELEFLFKKPTERTWLQNFEKLLISEPEFDRRWFDCIKRRFLLSKIGHWCLQGQISAEDLVKALKKLSFDDYFEEKTGYGNTTERKNTDMHQAFKVFWYEFKPGMGDQILKEISLLLPPVQNRTPHREPTPKIKAIDLYKEFLDQLWMDLQMTAFTKKEWNSTEVPGNSRTVTKLKALMDKWEEHRGAIDLNSCNELFEKSVGYLNDTKEAGLFDNMKRTDVTTEFYERQIIKTDLLQKHPVLDEDHSLSGDKKNQP